MFYRLKNRIDNPAGEFDKVGRFYPDDRTVAVRAVRAPSKAYPYSEMNAARTAPHCAEVCGVNDAAGSLAIIRRIAASAEKGEAVDEARRSIGGTLRSVRRAEEAALRKEAARLRAEAEREQEAAEREQAEAFRILSECNPARVRGLQPLNA